MMPPVVQLTDEQVANVLTYVRNSWGNTGEAVSPDEVRLVREDHN
jgi:nitrite reductase (NO-forming)